jgi:hypothetical protein
VEAVIDTNVLVYATVEDSVHHKEVTGRLEELAKVYIPTNVMIEYILVLKKLGVDEEFIINKVMEILSDEKTRLTGITKKDFEEALRMIEKEKVDVNRINDKVILSIARRNDLPLYTYDRQLRQQESMFGTMKG